MCQKHYGGLDLLKCWKKGVIVCIAHNVKSDILCVPYSSSHTVLGLIHAHKSIGSAHTSIFGAPELHPVKINDRLYVMAAGRFFQAIFVCAHGHIS